MCLFGVCELGNSLFNPRFYLGAYFDLPLNEMETTNDGKLWPRFRTLLFIVKNTEFLGTVALVIAFLAPHIRPGSAHNGWQFGNSCNVRQHRSFYSIHVVHGYNNFIVMGCLCQKFIIIQIGSTSFSKQFANISDKLYTCALYSTDKRYATLQCNQQHLRTGR